MTRLLRSWVLDPRFLSALTCAGIVVFGLGLLAVYGPERGPLDNGPASRWGVLARDWLVILLVVLWAVVHGLLHILLPMSRPVVSRRAGRARRGGRPRRRPAAVSPVAVAGRHRSAATSPRRRPVDLERTQRLPVFAPGRVAVGGGR